jgi:hypothetical protein
MRHPFPASLLDLDDPRLDRGASACALSISESWITASSPIRHRMLSGGGQLFAP